MDTPPKKDEEVYLFTFSPKGNTKDVQFTYYDHLQMYFKKWHYCMQTFEINPELNSNGNLHYHGYFIIKDKTKWYKSVLPKMKYNGLIKINKVQNNLDSAMVYPRKDRTLMSLIIKKYPVPYTDQHILLRQRKQKEENIITQIEEMSNIVSSCMSHDLDYGLDISTMYNIS